MWGDYRGGGPASEMGPPANLPSPYMSYILGQQRTRAEVVRVVSPVIDRLMDSAIQWGACPECVRPKE